MKIYKINSLTTILFGFLVICFIVFLPIIFIEALWNATVAKSYSDFTIGFWQALILWLVVLVSLNTIGIFKFEFAIEATDTFDKELLKKKLEGLQKKPGESPEIEQNSIKKEPADKN